MTSDEQPPQNHEATAKFMKIALAAMLLAAFVPELSYQFTTGQ
jgi:hypothetical protein